MKEFGIIKRLNYKNKSLVVFRLSFTKNHNDDLVDLFNFSLWFGCPDVNKKTGSKTKTRTFLQEFFQGAI